jgi:NAD(P)-dependent dehydrogenase (short-subunit alcohol dehydrogenase family)
LANCHRFAGLFHCLPLRPGKPFEMLDINEWRGAIHRNVKSLFNLAVTLDAVISKQESACVVAATRLGGAMGLNDQDGSLLDPTHAGVQGLLKTLEKEWSRVSCKSVDFAADALPDEIAERLLIEAGQLKGEVEIGYRGNERLVPRVERRSLNTSSRPVLDIGERSVILVTGGARGITAEIVRELAERHRPTLVLCGSSAEPSPVEDAATADCADARSLKAALIKAANARGETAAPATIENAYRRLLKEREIRETLDAVRRTARSVEYHQVDVRDESAFGALIEAIYAKHGRLDGVIHGAGIVEDKLIGDKTGESFDRVVETKLLSSFILTRKLQAESLGFFAFFASVAGTFGNRGQSDYGAANEILSKLALHLDRTWPGRVVAISWGPWDKTGMVSPEIKRQFEVQGIEAVPPDLGRWALDTELRFGGKGDVCPIWGNGPWAPKLRANVPVDVTRPHERHHRPQADAVSPESV